MKNEVTRGLYGAPHVIAEIQAEHFYISANTHTVQSMSRKSNCRDRAVAGSFFRNLNRELVYGNRLLTPEQLEL